MAKQQISVPLSDKQAAFVQQRADAEDRSRASVIRQCVEKERAASQAEPRPAAAA
jgi:hypothetical protein